MVITFDDLRFVYNIPFLTRMTKKTTKKFINEMISKVMRKLYTQFFNEKGLTPLDQGKSSTRARNQYS